MTPFAYSLVNAAIEKRMPKEQAKEARELMDDIHCFEVTDVLELIRQFMNQMKKETRAYVTEHMFLPAPRTWIEYNVAGTQHAYHLTQAERGQPIEITVVFREPGRAGFLKWGSINPSTLTTTVTADLHDDLPPEAIDHIETAHRFICAAICIINTPRSFGRRQHMPNKTLERKLLAKLGGAGKFPLHAWTTIRLEVTKPIDIDDGEPHEAHLTGRRALHFCRAYMRLARGAIEYVRFHYRGDAALGIKRSRYEVTK